jgi:DNA invertase Pin-like site-specific DNA recombinase
MFHILGAIAVFESNLIRERSYAELAAARTRGRKGRRREKLGDKQRAGAVDLYRQKNSTIDESRYDHAMSILYASRRPGKI